MDIDINKTAGGEEEYRPADYDSSIFEVTPTNSSNASSHLGGDMEGNNRAANFMENLNRKNIIIGLALLLGVFCIYKIVDVLMTSSTTRHKSTTLQAQMPKPLSPSMQQPANSSAVSSQTQLSVAAAPIVNRLNSLEQQSADEETNLSRLSTQVNDLQNALSNMDAKLTALSTSLETVANQVTAQQAALAAKQEAKRKAMRAAAAAPKPIYYVKALVPGRAWLVTQDGAAITVSLGNDLPGYGAVEVINPAQGTVITSSGAIIGYSSNDS